MKKLLIGFLVLGSTLSYAALVDVSYRYVGECDMFFDCMPRHIHYAGMSANLKKDCRTLKDLIICEGTLLNRGVDNTIGITVLTGAMRGSLDTILTQIDYDTGERLGSYYLKPIKGEHPRKGIFQFNPPVGYSIRIDNEFEIDWDNEFGDSADFRNYDLTEFGL